MATPQQNALASFFRSSEAALEDGQESCARAHIAAQRSAETATNVLALDAQVNWLTVAVVEQLKVSSMIHRLAWLYSVYEGHLFWFCAVACAASGKGP